jgi:hypothetical protein
MLSDLFHFCLPADNTIFWGIIIISFSLAFIPNLAIGEFPLADVKFIIL